MYDIVHFIDLVIVIGTVFVLMFTVVLKSVQFGKINV